MRQNENPGSISGWLRKNKAALQSGAIGLTVFLIIAGAWYSVGLYRQRKALEAEIAARYQQEQEQQSGSDTGQTAGDPENDLPVMGDTVHWQGKTYKRNSYVKAILGMGVDRSGGMEETTLSGDGGQSDGIFLLAQDTARNALQILLIPRDSMTEIMETDISLTEANGTELGKYVDHLTLAYAYGDGREKSCEYTVDAVSGLLCGLPIDSYMAADTDVIARLNDAVGGVTVTIPTAGMEQRDPAFVLGETVTLHGKQAEAFVRFRDINIDNSAIARMNQQKAYIDGFFQAVKATSKKDSRIVEKLFGMMEGNMVTNMHKDEYMKVALDALTGEGLNSGSFWMVPGTGSATDTYDEFYVNKEALIPILLELFYREV